jgi:K+-sensing histidine kinase KdpD
VQAAWYRQHRALVRVLALVVPLVVSGGLYLLAEYVPNSSAALILVLLVVAAASTGDLVAGLIAAASSALGFDYFLTQPYLTLRIDNMEDIQLAILLLLVGSAVSQLASWGIRQNQAATEQSAYVRAVLESADLASGSISDVDALPRVADAIGRVLGISEVSFEYGEQDAGAVVVQHDGTLTCRGAEVDLAVRAASRWQRVTAAIPVAREGRQVGYFRLGPLADLVRATREQRRVAVLLARQWSRRAQPRRARPEADEPGRAAIVP